MKYLKSEISNRFSGSAKEKFYEGISLGKATAGMGCASQQASEHA